MKQTAAPEQAFRFGAAQSYPRYKDSGVGWLGRVPAHWEIARLWRFSQAMSGGTPAREEPEYWGGGIPWVSAKDMKRRIIDSSEDTVTERAISETGLRLANPPVVLIVVRGMILAHTLPVAIAAVPVTINQDMKALSFRAPADPNFMAWLLEGIAKGLLAAIVEEAAHGTKAIRMDQWRSVAVPIPPTHEQRAISTFLERETARIDVLVAKKERLVELLQEQRTALVTRAVTRGLDSGVPMRHSGIEWLGEIPAHWELRRLKDLARRSGSGIQMGPFGSMLKDLALADTGYRLYGQENTISGRFDTGSRWLSPERYGELREYWLREGDIVLTRKGSLGNARLVPADIEPGAIDSDTIRVRVDAEAVDANFLVWLLHQAAYVEDQIASTRRGAVLGGLNTSTIADLLIALPPLDEQRRLLEYLRASCERLDRLAEKVVDAIRRLQELRTAVIFAAVTGKIDVRDEVA